MSIIKKIFKFPLHFLQLFSGAKSFEKNFLIGNKFLNEKGLHVLRVSLSQKLADMRRKSLSHFLTKEQLDSYDRDGFVVINDFLELETFEGVLSEINNIDFERFDMHQGTTITRRSMIDKDDLKSLPFLQKAKNDIRMINLIRYISSYHGQPLTTLQTVLAKPSNNSNSDPQTLIHSDTFQPTAKAWLFLTDVEENDGPFAYVKGSHKVTTQRYAWEKQISTSLNNVENVYARRGSLRISVDELEKLGYPQPTIMTVKANTLVVANTHGFHARCASNKKTVRIEIYSSLRRNPFLPFVASRLNGFHIASLPFIKNRLNRNVIEGLAILNKLGFRGNPWKSIGYGKAKDWPENNKSSQN